MTITAFTPLSRTAGHATAARPRLLTFAWRALMLAARRLAHRRAQRELLGMPESLLKDIGISRSEIPSVVRFGLDDTTRLHRGSIVLRPAPGDAATRLPLASDAMDRA